MNDRQENAEKMRLNADYQACHKWGPYVSDRQWGTVREDYSANGDAWNYITHDTARSRTYRWGEEGIGGICDNEQILCFSLALWNGKDPILKERFFGLIQTEGNHGEDVKEYYYYLDNTPSHSYMKMLYKYPHAEFPYAKLVDANLNKGKKEEEYELIDTGIFDNNEYFDVFIEYAKAGPEDILIKITALNRGHGDAGLNLIPGLWFRNTWSWGYDNYKPSLKISGEDTVAISHNRLGDYFLYCGDHPQMLFCENESNLNRLFNMKDVKGYFKDGINDFIVGGNREAVNPGQSGTKAGMNYKLTIKGSGSETIRLRLSNVRNDKPFDDFDLLFHQRLTEADEFYNDLQHGMEDREVKEIQRQALGGILWNKQFYYYDVQQWLDGDPAMPKPPRQRQTGRNYDWFHLNNRNIISMPDKWEYPWYATWDLAFHCVNFALIDPSFAKKTA